MLFLCEDVPDASPTDYVAVYHFISDNLDLLVPTPAAPPPPKRRCSIEAMIDAMYDETDPTAHDIPRSAAANPFEFRLCLLPLKDAAAHVGFSPPKLKKIIRELGIRRWPCRRLHKIRRVVLAAKTTLSRQFVRQAVMDSMYDTNASVRSEIDLRYIKPCKKEL